MPKLYTLIERWVLRRGASQLDFNSTKTWRQTVYGFALKRGINRDQRLVDATGQLSQYVKRYALTRGGHAHTIR